MRNCSPLRAEDVTGASPNSRQTPPGMPITSIANEPGAQVLPVAAASAQVVSGEHVQTLRFEASVLKSTGGKRMRFRSASLPMPIAAEKLSCSSAKLTNPRPGSMAVPR
jgi:hypothetical protein